MSESKIKIHRTAMVDEKAILAENVEVGPNTIIGPKVKIGVGTKIGANVVIDGSTIIGENCQIFTGAIIGTQPQDLKYKGEDTKVVIGDRCTIREYVTVNRGTISAGETKIGNDCLLMAYVHVAHDCKVGNRVILANNATLAGHVEVEDGAIIGGLTAIHQFTKVGILAIVGGASRVAQDILPYTKSTGNPLKLYGLNTIGLERNNISVEIRNEIKKAYKILFRSQKNISQAMVELELIENKSKELEHFIFFIKNSERGIARE